MGLSSIPFVLACMGITLGMERPSGVKKALLWVNVQVYHRWNVM